VRGGEVRTTELAEETNDVGRAARMAIKAHQKVSKLADGGDTKR
jgi:hypothetical protein